MTWLIDLLTKESVTHSILVLSLIAGLGLWLGSIQIFRFKLGIAAVLFVGLGFGHLHFTLDTHVIEFIREFGLILFIFTIGTQVGPGFFSSLQKNGLHLNLLAASIVILGLIVTYIIKNISGLDTSVMIGLFSGAVTNTPSLGAAQQMIKDVLPDQAQTPGLSYAVAYPFGIIGIVLTMTLIRYVFRINIQGEVAEILKKLNTSASKLSTLNILVKNPNINGIMIKKIPSLKESGILISRIQHGNSVCVATADSLIHTGDILLAIGKKEQLENIQLILGEISDIDLRTGSHTISSQRIIITQPQIVGKRPRELNLFQRFGVTLTRVSRAEIEFTPTADFQFQYGDRVIAVGEEESLKKVAHEFGNSLKSLDHPQIIPFFLGIFLGVVLGSMPFFIPGMPVPLKLGLAGGPLIIAILMSRIGHIGKIIWHMPESSNLILREFGMILFLSCVGLKAGEKFFDLLINGEGLYWMALAALITLIPILIVGFCARYFMKMNYVTLCGLLSGSMTDPPALAFANSMTQSDSCAISYATVYPLTMFLRVIGTQIFILLFL